MRKVNIGLVGCGVVGSALITQLHEKHERIAEEFAIDIRVSKVLVRNHKTARDVPNVSILFSNNESAAQFSSVVTTNVGDVTNADDVDLLVEVAGGVDDAYAIISAALEHGTPVVTANKALLAVKEMNSTLKLVRTMLTFFLKLLLLGEFPLFAHCVNRWQSNTSVVSKQF